jgi:hypothetical protein
MPCFPGSGNDCARFRGHSLHHIEPEEIYFFLAAFFLLPFFLADFLALVAIVISLHVELVRAQYIHKLKTSSKGCVQICCTSSHRDDHASDEMKSHSLFVTGVMESRLPRRSTIMFFSLPFE